MKFDKDNLRYGSDLVSVVIPCYNNSSVIKRCMESVLNQTYDNIEVIVVDDGSTDSPESELSKFSDKRLRPIVRLSHAGVSNARNIGIDKAKGKYIIFIDADDWVEPNHILYLKNALTTADLSMIKMRVIKNDEEIRVPVINAFYEKYSHLNKDQFSLLFTASLLSSPCNKIYKLDIIRKYNLKFDTKVSYAEDLLFNLEYFRKINDVNLCNKSTYNYIKYHNSGTNRYHKNIGYTLKLISQSASKLTNSKLDENVKVELMRLYLWGIIALFHPESLLSSHEIIKEIKLIINLKEYKMSKSETRKLNINPILKIVLERFNSTFIYWIFNLKIRKSVFFLSTAH